MTISAKPVLNSVLRKVSQILFVAVLFVFYGGGRAIHEFAAQDRILAEMEGIGLAIALGAAGRPGKPLCASLSLFAGRAK
jgi:hypothetical protein